MGKMEAAECKQGFGAKLWAPSIVITSALASGVLNYKGSWAPPLRIPTIWDDGVDCFLSLPNLASLTEPTDTTDLFSHLDYSPISRIVGLSYTFNLPTLVNTSQGS